MGAVLLCGSVALATWAPAKFDIVQYQGNDMYRYGYECIVTRTGIVDCLRNPQSVVRFFSPVEGQPNEPMQVKVRNKQLSKNGCVQLQPAVRAVLKQCSSTEVLSFVEDLACARANDGFKYSQISTKKTYVWDDKKDFTGKTSKPLPSDGGFVENLKPSFDFTT